jgi:hypothetical protein
MFRRLNWRLQRYATRHLAPGPHSILMAMHLGGVSNASFVFCYRCERPLAAVAVPENSRVVDIIGLGCVWCGHRTPVRAGIVSAVSADQDQTVGQEAAD